MNTGLSYDKRKSRKLIIAAFSKVSEYMYTVGLPVARTIIILDTNRELGCYSGYDNDFLKRVFDFRSYVRINDFFWKKSEN